MNEKEPLGVIADEFTIEDVGSTLLEDLAQGIYKPYEVIREYVQNAVDAHRLYKNATGNDPLQPIQIEVHGNQLTIFDYGIGMDETDIKKVKSIAVSRKRDAEILLTGHKGVGTWAGLSYFETLVMYTTKRGSNREYRLTIKFKSIVEAISPEANIGEVLNPNYKIEYFDAEIDSHYTIVTLDNPNPARSPNQFLESAIVQDAVRRICPCEIEPNFVFNANLLEWHNSHKIETYPIEVNGTRVFKLFPSALEGWETGTITINDTPVAEYWTAVHQQSKKLSPTEGQLSGFRLLQNGFVLGEANPYSDADLPNYSSLNRNTYLQWHIGEVHITSQRLRPNLQRNHLEESEDTRQFIEKFREFYRNLEYKDRILSKKRDTLKRYKTFDQQSQELLSRTVMALTYDEQQWVVKTKRELDDEDELARSRKKDTDIEALRDDAVRSQRRRLVIRLEDTITRHKVETGDAKATDWQPVPSSSQGAPTRLRSSNEIIQRPATRTQSGATPNTSAPAGNSLANLVSAQASNDTYEIPKTFQESLSDDLEGEDVEVDDQDAENPAVASVVPLDVILTLIEQVLDEELDHSDAKREAILSKFRARVKWIVANA